MESTLTDKCTGRRQIVTLLVIGVTHASPRDTQEPVRIQSPLVIDDKSDFCPPLPHFSHCAAYTALYLRRPRRLYSRCKINVATYGTLSLDATTLCHLLFRGALKNSTHRFICLSMQDKFIGAFVKRTP